MPNFKPVPGYFGLYSVSDDGRVWSNARSRKDGRSYKEKELKPHASTNGYLTVSLYRDGVPKVFTVHRLVALAFLPMIEGKACVNHRDGNRHNNVSWNLEWCTHSENNLDGFKRGRVVWNRGNRKARPYMICEWCGGGFIQKRVAQLFCSRSCTAKRNGNIEKRKAVHLIEKGLWKP